MRAFLDANILFSAALGGDSFALLWELARAGKVELITSRYCLLETESNRHRKRPQRLAHHRLLLEHLRIAPDAEMGTELTTEAQTLLPEKDIAVYTAAIMTGADVLLTGDRRHFGRLMGRDDLPIAVKTIRTFLLEGPPAP